MKLTGNLRNIKSTRDDSNRSIEIHVDRIEYITHKKDGKYLQEYDYVDEPETPLIITGDCLARIPDKHLEEGEFAFQVYDKEGDDYVLNPGKQLEVTLEYDFDLDLQILTSVTYMVTVPAETFSQIRSEGNKRRKQQQKGRKSR